MQLLLERKPVAVERDVIRRINTQMVTVSVLSRYPDAVNAATRNLVTQTKYHTHIMTLSQLVDSGSHVYEAVCVSGPTPTPYVPCDYLVADVVFLVDRMLLVNNGSLASELLVNIIDNFGIGQKVRVAVVLYGGSNAETLSIALNDYTEKTILEEAIVWLTYQSDVTDSLDLAQAVDFIDREVFVPRKGRYATYGKFIVNVVARSPNETPELARALSEARSHGIDIVTVATEKSVSDRYTYLSPNESLVLTSDHGHGIDTVEKNLVDLLCLAFTGSTPPPTEPTPPALPSPPPCTPVADIVFIVDEELLADDELLAYTKQYFQKMSDLIDYQKDTTRSGLIVTGRTPRRILYLNRPIYKYKLTDGISSVRPRRPLAPIAIQAHIQAAIDMFNYERPSNVYVQRELILIVHRLVSGVITKEIWDALSSLDVSFHAIAVETSFLESHAIKKYNYRQFPVRPAKFLPYTAYDLVTLVCKPAPPPTPPPAFTTAPPPPLNCPAADVVFLYDAILLSPEADIAKVLTFMKETAKVLSNRGLDARSRFAAVSYGESPELNFNLGQHLTVPQVAKALDSIHYSGQINPANVGKAIYFVLDNVVDASPRQRAVDSTSVIVLLMARKNYDDMLPAVQAVRARGLTLITYLIGELNIRNQAQLSTVPYGTIPVQYVRDLVNLQYEALELICTVGPRTTTPPQPPTTTTAEPFAPCKIDVVFVVDDALTSSRVPIGSVHQYLDDFAMSIAFGNTAIEAGVVRIGKEAHWVTNSTASKRKKYIVEIDDNLSISPSTGSLSMVFGLKQAEDLLKSDGRSNDSSVSRLIVFIMRRYPSQFISKEKMDSLLRSGTQVMSIVTDDASSIPWNQIVNYYGYVNAYRYHY